MKTSEVAANDEDDSGFIFRRKTAGWQQHTNNTNTSSRIISINTKIAGYSFERNIILC